MHKSPLFLINAQKFFTQHRQSIIVSFLLLEIGLIAWWMLIYWQAATNYPSVVWILFNWGPIFGQLAVGLYVLTLIPGIIVRLKWWSAITQPIGLSLMLFRRHFGILMFILAFIHLTFSSTLPYLALYNFQPPALPALRSFEIMGAIGWALLFPLWLTSNDWAVKKLGRWWKREHRLTYVALFFIFTHVALQGGLGAIALAVTGILVGLSWVVFWFRTKKIGR